MSDLKKDQRTGEKTFEERTFKEKSPETDGGRRRMTFRQIIAWIAIILLVGIYVVTLICSLIDSTLAEQMFHASLYCTFFIPVMSWVFIMTVKLVKENKSDETYGEDRPEEQKEKK